MENNILIPESLFIDLIEYFDERQDADGISEGFTANKEMRLLIRLLNPTVAVEFRNVQVSDTSEAK